MNTTARRRTRLFALVLYAAYCIFGFAIAAAAQDLIVNFDREKGTLEVKAHEVPLDALLSDVAKKTGLKLELDVAVSDPVSFHLQPQPLEDAIKHLLGGRSYSLNYEKTGEGKFLPSRLRVLGKGPGVVKLAVSDKTRAARPGSPPMPPGAGSRMKTVDKSELERLLQDRVSLAKQVSASADRRGARINEVPDDSPLRDLGIEEGDVIEKVNGRPIQSFTQFLDALPAESSNPSVLRIMKRRNGMPDPVYIRLQ